MRTSKLTSAYLAIVPYFLVAALYVYAILTDIIGCFRTACFYSSLQDMLGLGPFFFWGLIITSLLATFGLIRLVPRIPSKIVACFYACLGAGLIVSIVLSNTSRAAFYGLWAHYVFLILPFVFTAILRIIMKGIPPRLS